MIRIDILLHSKLSFLSKMYIIKIKLPQLIQKLTIGWITIARSSDFVEWGSSVVERWPLNRGRPFPKQCCHFKAYAFSFSPWYLSLLSCINEYLAVDIGGNVWVNSLRAVIEAWLKLPREVKLVLEWTVLPGDKVLWAVPRTSITLQLQSG